MSDLTTPSRKLTHNGIRKLMDAAVEAASHDEALHSPA